MSLSPSSRSQHTKSLSIIMQTFVMLSPAVIVCGVGLLLNIGTSASRDTRLSSFQARMCGLVLCNINEVVCLATALFTAPSRKALFSGDAWLSVLSLIYHHKKHNAVYFPEGRRSSAKCPYLAGASLTITFSCAPCSTFPSSSAECLCVHPCCQCMPCMLH